MSWSEIAGFVAGAVSVWLYVRQSVWAWPTGIAYVLTSDDIPFDQDGTRDGEHLRGWMTDRFRTALAASTEPWIEVRGGRAERLAAAVSRIDALLALPIGAR